jgi:hypothetical protein
MNTSWSNNDENNINLSSLHEQIPNFGWLSPIIAPIGTHIQKQQQQQQQKKKSKNAILSVNVC